MQSLREQIRPFWIAGTILIVLLILQWIGALRPVERMMALFVQPLQSIGYGAVSAVYPLYSSSEQTLIKENADMKDQLAAAVLQVDKLEEQLSQYQEYEAQLAFIQANEYQSVPAVIISRIGSDRDSQFITLNQGAGSGIEVGLPVVYGNGILVGVVYTVQESYAEVALLTSNLVTLQVQVQNDSRTPGLVTGEFGVSAQMQYILKENAIEPGEIVITSGEDKNIPGGLVVGVVEQVKNESSDLFKSATVSPLVDYSSRSVVSVILPN